MKKSIGIDVPAPKERCDDVNCPFHGTLKLRGRVFVGEVVSDKMRRSAVIQWERRAYIPKYERYEKKRTKIHAHSPDCLNAKKGDQVRVMESRPLSKTKNFVIVEIIKKKTG
ncbi:30S ribosomal protein S17 [Candidatus Woesearchaeota archaeon]|nr:30S ribosomal protein S17 [Candidatus Woesearchaeota archaeon]